MNRRLAAIAAALALVLPAAACSTGPTEDDAPAAAPATTGSGGSKSGGWAGSSDSTGDGASTEDLPPMSGSLEELLVAPDAMPELTFLPPEPEDTSSSADSAPAEESHTEPAHCAPQTEDEQRDSVNYIFTDSTNEYWYQLHMLGQGVGLDKFDKNISDCPQYTTFTGDTSVETQLTRIDGPQLEGADVRAADMTTTTRNPGAEPRTLHSSAYMAEVRGVTFFVQLTVHNGEEIGPEQRRLMDKLFEAQVRQLRYAG